MQITNRETDSTTQATDAERGDAIEQTSAAPVARDETRERVVRVSPPVDIFENDEELLLVADLPGLSRDAIELDVDAGTLSLTASQPELGRVFRRAFALPDTVDPAGVEASFERGVLTVHLRKREDVRPRRIPIAAG